MQSKISFFNGTLFRKNLARFWPLWGMASFLSGLFPLALLLELMQKPHPNMVPLNFTEAYYRLLAHAAPIISLLYAILCAMAVWSYLYNARSVGLMHTLPIRREGLFLTNFLSGMAMLLIPYVVLGGLCVLISLAYGCLDPLGLAVTILGVLGESFFYFSSATLVAFITSNLFALPVLYFLLHFLAVLLDWLVSIFAKGFLFGLSGSYSGAVEWLSPTVYLIRKLYVDTSYEAVFVKTPSMRYGGYTENVLTEVHLENVWLIGVYALVGVVFLALAYALYRRRRSESAGDVVAVGWMKPLFRYGLAALAALLGGWALYYLFWEQFQTSQYYGALPMAVCMAVAGVIGYYIASMLLAKSLRVFKGSWIGVALVAVGCGLVCCVLHFDALGISTRVPEISEVRQVSLYTADNSYDFYPGEEDELLEQVRQVHQAIVADADYIIQEVNSGSWYSRDMGAVSFHVTYTLSNGLTVERNYFLPMARDRMAQAGTYDDLLDQLVNSDAMKAKRLHVNDSRYTVERGNLYIEQRYETVDLNSREAAAVLEAVAKDAASGAWGTYGWFENDRGGAYALNLELAFTYSNDYGENSLDWISIALRPGMENTIASLKELDLVTDEDLVTYAELYPEKYGYEAEYDAAALNSRVPAGVEYTYEDPAAGIGVIGGADGPTEVFAAGVTY